jgi:Ca2+-transporting ATPase
MQVKNHAARIKLAEERQILPTTIFASPVEKQVAASDDAGLPLADRRNMAFKGTVVLYGRACGLVVATGMQTELGRIAGMLDGAGETRTPLQQRLTVFGRQIAVAALAICVVIFLLGVLRGEAPLLMLLTAASLAVAAIPRHCRPW